MNPLLGLDTIEKLAGYVVSRRDRRIITFGALTGCSAGIVGLILFGRDTELHRLALNGFFWLAGAIALFHVLGGQQQRRTAAEACKALASARQANEGNRP